MQLEVLDPPSLPVNPASPNRLVIVLIGLLLGLIVGGVIAQWRGNRRPPGGTGLLAQHTGAALLLSALLIVTGVDLAVGIAPWPYTSRATLEFKTPESRRQTIANQRTLTADLLSRVSGDGAWYHVDLSPTTGSRASVAIRYSNRFKAQMMLQTLISRIPDARVIDPPSLASDAPTGIYGPALVLAGVFLAVSTTVSFLRNRRKTPSLQTA